MDEYLSEKEQIEQLRQWWSEYGWYLLGGLVIAVIGLIGWGQYRQYQDRQAEAAAEIFLSLKEVADGTDVAAAEALVARLREEHPDSAYTDHAGLLLAKMQLVTAPDRAIEELRTVMETTDERELSLIARTRLARALAYRERYDEALRVLEVDDPGRFSALINDVRGDIYNALGRTDDARSAYLSAMTASGAEVLDRNFLQMKLNDLERSAAVASDVPAGDAADAVPASSAPAADTESSEATSESSDPPAASDAENRE